ncbi:hypothetical protein [Shouchella patagoniensis]|uniref:hypothetical protein n=1 Tax=Shouchella patagoniensis TaxID=228576 RepID=UPI00099519A6|nr:hypothetical protein [Shouchella patagoniensis]
MYRYHKAFTPPVDYYDESIKEIDEKICSLIRERKNRTNDDPGFPTQSLIGKWATKYRFYDGYLNDLFVTLLNEDMHKPIIEPKEYLKNVPVMKSFEKDGLFYAVTFIRQYQNASIVYFTIDKEHSNRNHDPHTYEEFRHFILSIKEGKTDYDCALRSGNGSDGHMSYSFIVSPPLPVHETEMELIFSEVDFPYENKSGFEFSITL